MGKEGIMVDSSAQDGVGSSGAAGVKGALGALIELSKLDVLVAGLEAQKKKLEGDVVAKKAEIESFQKIRATRMATLETRQGLVSREEKAIKGERDRINERRRSLSGQTDYKVQQAMEREIEFVSKQVGQREDVLLGVMREVEMLQNEVVNLEGAITKSTQDLASLQEKAEGEVGAINERLAEYGVERQKFIGIIGVGNAGLVAYNRVRNRYPQNPIVSIVNRNSCGGCFMSIGPQQIVQASRGDIVKCAGCSRILQLPDEIAAQE